MTYQEAAKAALDCQNAVNLSGVAYTFKNAIDAICEECHRLGEGTEWKNKNPIVTLFLMKMADLNGSYFQETWGGDAFEQCRRIANGQH